MSENYEFTDADKAHASRRLAGTMDQFKPGDLLLCRDGAKAVYVGGHHPEGRHWIHRADGEFSMRSSGLYTGVLPRHSVDIIGPWSSRFPKLEWDGNRADTPFGEYKVLQNETGDWSWVFGRDADCGGFESESEAKEHAGRDWADRLALAMGEEV